MFIVDVVIYYVLFGYRYSVFVLIKGVIIFYYCYVRYNKLFIVEVFSNIVFSRCRVFI